MTEAAAFLVMVTIVVLAVLHGAGMFVGNTADEYERACARDGGVAQIATDWTIRNRTVVVCKDGHVRGAHW